MRLLSFALLFLASGAAAQGRLAFEAPRHDFGTFTEGETVTHVFRFTNAGDAPLALADVDASCGCTTPSWTREPVAPGASGEVTVAFDSDARPGPFEKTVYVRTPEAGSVTLRIAGEVTSIFVAAGVQMGALTFAADSVDLRLASGEAVQFAFRFQNTGTRPVRIREVEASLEGVRVVFPQRPVFPGDVAAVLILAESLDAVSPEGAMDLHLVVQTDDEAAPEKRLRLTASR